MPLSSIHFSQYHGVIVCFASRDFTSILGGVSVSYVALKRMRPPSVG